MAEKTRPLMSGRLTALSKQIHVNDIAQLATASMAFELARPIEIEAELPAELSA
jgi:hypothetical protein